MDKQRWGLHRALDRMRSLKISVKKTNLALREPSPPILGPSRVDYKPKASLSSSSLSSISDEADRDLIRRLCTPSASARPSRVTLYSDRGLSPQPHVRIRVLSEPKRGSLRPADAFPLLKTRAASNPDNRTKPPKQRLRSMFSPTPSAKKAVKTSFPSSLLGRAKTWTRKRGSEAKAKVKRLKSASPRPPPTLVVSGPSQPHRKRSASDGLGTQLQRREIHNLSRRLRQGDRRRSVSVGESLAPQLGANQGRSPTLCRGMYFQGFIEHRDSSRREDILFYQKLSNHRDLTKRS